MIDLAAARETFERSAAFTVGIEEEYALVDPETLLLIPRFELLRDADIKVSLFIAPDVAQVEASHALGVEQIELHTGEYAHATGDAEAELRELGRLGAAARRGRELGLEIAAGHGLTTANVPALVVIPELVELNIGHAVIADAVFSGLAGAVRAMLGAIEKGRGTR